MMKLEEKQAKGRGISFKEWNGQMSVDVYLETRTKWKSERNLRRDIMASKQSKETKNVRQD